jgi:hypothetical protein
MENYPVFANSYTSETNIEVHSNFAKYLHYTDVLVNHVQNNSPDKTEIPLTFYPIAKNVRIPASYMAINILNNKSSFVDNLARTGEEDFWLNFKKMGDWYPWLWARGRIDSNFTNFEGWSYYFDSFTAKSSTSIQNTLISPMKPPDNLVLFFCYLSCIKYVFQLNEIYKSQMVDYKTRMMWPTESKILAVQIRRGETCTKDGSMTDRPFFHLDAYIRAIEKMLDENQYDYIYISTDSDREIDELHRLRPEWKLLYLPIDRSQFFRMNEKPVDLEVFCTLEPDRIPFIVDTGLADLFFISQCQGYISTISVSEFSRCGWFLQMAEQGRLTPYINMNDEPLDMTKRDKLLLL